MIVLGHAFDLYSPLGFAIFAVIFGAGFLFGRAIVLLGVWLWRRL